MITTRGMERLGPGKKWRYYSGLLVIFIISFPGPGLHYSFWVLLQFMFHAFFWMFVVSHEFLEWYLSIYNPFVLSKSKITPYKTNHEIHNLWFFKYRSSITALSLSLKRKNLKLFSSLTHKQLTSPAHLFSEMSNLSLISVSKATVLIRVSAPLV